MPNNNSQEFTLGDRYARLANGDSYYPKDQFGNEYRLGNLRLILRNGNYIYPKTQDGKPLYNIINHKEVYEIVANKEIIGVGLDGEGYYAVDEFGNEYYPNDNSPAKYADKTTEKYAIAVDGSHIFPTDQDGNEYYFNYVYSYRPKTIPNRYARSFSGDEIYPLTLTFELKERQFLINNEYAIDKNNKRFYPKDGFKNEYYREITQFDIFEYKNKNTLSQVLLDRYALTNDGKVILPIVQRKYYINLKIKPLIYQKDKLGKLITDENEVSGYLINITDPTFIPVPDNFNTYEYKDRITKEKRKITPKQSFSPAVTVVGIINPCDPFYKRWCFWVSLIVLLIVKCFIVWWFYLKSSWQNLSLFSPNVSQGT